MSLTEDLRAKYTAAKIRQQAALHEWRQITHHVNNLRQQLGEAGELDCEGCGKPKATFRSRGCGRWWCSPACHDEHC